LAVLALAAVFFVFAGALALATVFFAFAGALALATVFFAFAGALAAVFFAFAGFAGAFAAFAIRVSSILNMRFRFTGPGLSVPLLRAKSFATSNKVIFCQ
jgi:hypothetical protein